jgi:hypothetical protein
VRPLERANYLAVIGTGCLLVGLDLLLGATARQHSRHLWGVVFTVVGGASFAASVVFYVAAEAAVLAWVWRRVSITALRLASLPRKVLGRKQGGVRVRSAFYGPADKPGYRTGVSVTHALRALVRGGGTAFVADNPTLMGSEEADPYKWIYKSLRLRWRVDGRSYKRVFKEGTRVDLLEPDSDSDALLSPASPPA